MQLQLYIMQFWSITQNGKKKLDLRDKAITFFIFHSVAETCFHMLQCEVAKDFSAVVKALLSSF